MPHVVIKLVSGRTDEQKKRLADEIANAVMKTLNSDESAISVAVEDVPQSEWTARVYNPDILGNEDNLFKRPGYTPR
jgi:4-oxalocrotonate tautomerase